MQSGFAGHIIQDLDDPKGETKAIVTPATMLASGHRPDWCCLDVAPPLAPRAPQLLRKPVNARFDLRVKMYYTVAVV